MTTFEITSPDGRKFRVTGPEGSTKEQALAQVQERSRTAPKEPDYSPTGSTMENFLAAAGKAYTDLGRGAKQIAAGVADFVAPRPATMESLITGQDPSRSAEIQREIDESRRRDKALMDTKAGIAGNIAGTVATALPAMLVPGAQGYAGSAITGATLGALQPTSGDESRLTNATLGAASGAAGKYVGDKVAGAVTSRLADAKQAAATAAAQNAPRDAALAAAQAEGYVLPPRMVQKQGVMGSLLEGFGGKVKLEQLASNKNQTVTNALARKELGLAADDVLDAGVLQGIRARAGQAYDAITQVPQVQATPQYFNAVNQLEKQFSVFNSKFPQLANRDIEPMLEAMRQGTFTGKEAVDFVRHMRQTGNLNANVANTVQNANAVRNLGKAQLAAADTMDNLLEESLRSSGNAKLFGDYLAARQLIAKTHTIENAMDGSGNVSARELLKQLEGKPYGGKLKTAADFASSFPKAAQDVAKVEPYSVTDAGMMALLGTGGGLPAAAIPLARPAARSLALSPTYQALTTTPTYGPGVNLRLAALLADNPAVRYGATAGTAAGALEYAKK